MEAAIAKCGHYVPLLNTPGSPNRDQLAKNACFHCQTMEKIKSRARLFIINYLDEFYSSTLSSLWNLFPNRNIDFVDFAGEFHQLAEAKLISIVEIKNKKTDFTDYVAISDSFEII